MVVTLANGKTKSGQLLNQGETPSVVLRGFAGLSLKLDLVNRPKESFQQLDNFDLYIPGSIRKIAPPTKYNGPFGAPILNCIEYLAQPNNPQGGIRRVLGIAGDGNIYDLANPIPTNFNQPPTSSLLGSFIPTIPFMMQYSGYYVPFNIRSWMPNTVYANRDAVIAYAADGNAYVFVVTTPGTSAQTVLLPGFGPNVYGVPPIWPSTPFNGTFDSTNSVFDNTVGWTNMGLVNSTRFLANYLCIVVPGVQPIRYVEWQYDPADLNEFPTVTIGQMGVSAPQNAIELAGFVTTPNLNGYAPSAGRAYAWTLYNPNTLQESALAPFVGETAIYEADNSFAQVRLNGSFLQPLPPPGTRQPFRSYQSFYLAIPQAALFPKIGTGYSAIRVYATKDGGSDFFLVPQLFDAFGTLITSADGSIPVGGLGIGTDYFPIPGTHNATNSIRLYEGSGPVNFAPDPQDLGLGSWSQGAGSAIVITSNTAPDGANSFTAFGTGSAFPHSTYVSAKIKVSQGTWAFGIYMDATSLTGGTISAEVRRLDGTSLLTLIQTPGVASVVNNIFTVPSGVAGVQIVVSINGGTSPVGQSINWSDMALYFSATFPFGQQTNYPTPDSSLIIPSPAPFENYPPPVAAMAEIWNDALFLVDNNDQTKIWYSKRGSFEQFGKNAFVRTTASKNNDQVLEIIKCFDRLIVGKGRSVEQIVSYPPSDPVPIDPQHGMLARRASITWGSSILGIFTDGLGQVELSAAIQENNIQVGMSSALFGDDVKPIIDAIDQETLYSTNTGVFLPCPAIYNKMNLFLLAYALGQGQNINNNILGYYLGRNGKGFFNLTQLPGGSLGILTIKEIQLPVPPSLASNRYFALPPGNGSYFLLALAADKNVYVMFNGAQDGTLVATAITQPLPTPVDLPEEAWDTDKNFEYLYTEGEDIANFRVSFAMDQDPTQALNTVVFNPSQPLTKKFRINKRGKSITIKLTHSVATPNTPVLSYMKLAYSLIGERTY